MANKIPNLAAIRDWTNGKINNIKKSLVIGEQQYYLDKQDEKWGINTDPERGADTFVPFKSSTEEITSSNILEYAYGHPYPPCIILKTVNENVDHILYGGDNIKDSSGVGIDSILRLPFNYKDNTTYFSNHPADRMVIEKPCTMLLYFSMKSIDEASVSSFAKIYCGWVKSTSTAMMIKEGEGISFNYINANCYLDCLAIFQCDKGDVIIPRIRIANSSSYQSATRTFYLHGSSCIFPYDCYNDLIEKEGYDDSTVEIKQYT